MKTVGIVATIIAAACGLVGLGLYIGSDSRARCREALEDCIEGRSPSGAEPTVGSGAATKDWTASITRGLTVEIGATGYAVEIKDIEPTEDSYAIAVVLHGKGNPEEGTILAGGAMIINGVCVEVRSATLARAELRVVLP